MRRAILLLTATAAMLLVYAGAALADHDTGSPQLTSSEPGPGETIARSASIKVEFSEALDPATLIVETPYGPADNVELYKYNKKKKKFQFFANTDVSCDEACDTLTLDPYPDDTSRLLAAGKYKVRVWRDEFGLKDPDGNRLSTHVSTGYVLRDLKFFGPDAVIEWTFRAA